MGVTSEDLITLENLGNGVALEKWRREHEKVLQNIDDPNKKDGTRSVTLKVTYRPSTENPEFVGMSVECSSSLQPDKPATLSAVVGVENGKPLAREYMSQKDLPLDIPGVTDLAAKRGSK